MSNNVKPCTKQSIDELKEGNVVPVMATGDNLLTSIAVSYKCSILTNKVYYSCEKAENGDILFIKKKGYKRVEPTYSNIGSLDIADEDSHLLVSHSASYPERLNSN